MKAKDLSGTAGNDVRGAPAQTPTTRGARYPSALPYSGYWQFTPFAALRMSWSPHSGYGGSVVPGEAAAASVDAAQREPLVLTGAGQSDKLRGFAV